MGSAIEKIMDWWDYHESTIGSRLKGVSEDYINFIKDWKDKDKRNIYEQTKIDFVDQYGVNPAKFVGYIQESSDMWEDVINASKETNVDPNILYSIGMQEGMVTNFIYKEHDNAGQVWKSPDDSVINKYKSGKFIDTYNAVGLDTFWDDQDILLEKGYLQSPIYSDSIRTTNAWNRSLDRIKAAKIPNYTASFENTKWGPLIFKHNEKGHTISTGQINEVDSWRGIGAMIRQHEDYIDNIFSNRKLDFDSLNENDKLFWIYASFNGGPGNAASLLDSYGIKPLENKSLNQVLQLKNNPKSRRYDEGETYSLFLENQGIDESLIDWMENVGRTVGSNTLLSLYNPFGE